MARTKKAPSKGRRWILRNLPKGKVLPHHKRPDLPPIRRRGDLPPVAAKPSDRPFTHMPFGPKRGDWHPFTPVKGKRGDKATLMPPEQRHPVSDTRKTPPSKPSRAKGKPEPTRTKPGAKAKREDRANMVSKFGGRTQKTEPTVPKGITLTGATAVNRHLDAKGNKGANFGKRYQIGTNRAGQEVHVYKSGPPVLAHSKAFTGKYTPPAQGGPTPTGYKPPPPKPAKPPVAGAPPSKNPPGFKPPPKKPKVTTPTKVF